MKNIILVFYVILITAPAFAQRYINCQVVMLNQSNRLIQRFYGQTDWRTGMCRNALHQCNYEIHRRNIYGARCVQLNGNGW